MGKQKIQIVFELDKSLISFYETLAEYKKRPVKDIMVDALFAYMETVSRKVNADYQELAGDKKRFKVTGR